MYKLLWVVTAALLALAAARTDQDFEFDDDSKSGETVAAGGGHARTYLYDPHNALCRSLVCKKREVCVLRDAFTALCANKKDILRRGDKVVGPGFCPCAPHDAHPAARTACSEPHPRARTDHNSKGHAHDKMSSRAEGPCTEQRKEALASGIVGTYVPTCDERGFYTPQQCWSSNGICWCAKPNGDIVPGSRSDGEPSCSDSKGHAHDNMSRRAEGPCTEQRKEALASGIVGTYVPTCDERGFYTPQQCWSSNGICWCAKPNGDIVPGSRSDGEPSCSDEKK